MKGNKAKNIMQNIEYIEAKKGKRILQSKRAKCMQNGSMFASFHFKAKKIKAKRTHPTAHLHCQTISNFEHSALLRRCELPL